MLSASNEAEQLVTFALHRLPVARLHIEAEERLGVRGAEVEPPVAKVDRETVEVVYLHVLVLREVVLDLFECRFLILDLGVDLTRAHVRVDGGEEIGDGTLLAADELSDREHSDDARVGEVVVPEVEVGRVLPSEGGVVLAHLRLDDGVAGLGSYGLPTLALDELGERFRADRAVQYCRAGLLLQDVLGDEGGCEVARDGRALFVDDEAAVGVAVEGDPEISALCDHTLLKLFDVLWLDGVRWVV